MWQLCAGQGDGELSGLVHYVSKIMQKWKERCGNNVRDEGLVHYVSKKREANHAEVE